MYSTVVDNSATIQVTTSKHVATYAIDGSAMNPLEAFYASLAGCAAVYAKKSCHKLGVPAAGIEISCKPFTGAGGVLNLSKFKTEVHFPVHFTTEQKTAILAAIAECAVKKVVQDGQNVEFPVVEV